MNLTQIEANLQQVVKSINKETFIYDFLLAYGQPKASITRLQQGGLNLSKKEGEILWKTKLFFKTVENDDVHLVINELKAYEKLIKHDPRFIIVTDFETLLAIDRKTSDTLDIPVLELLKQFDFFLPLAGMEKTQHQSENPADVKAAERMAKLYDEIKKDNPTDTAEAVHSLNVFLSRLLFCFFAEDTGIFDDGLFTNSIASHTQPDGSDLSGYLEKLFDVLNTDTKNRNDLPAYLDAFPYVNGGLFLTEQPVPVFTRRSRQAIIGSGELQWRDINPDIFGSMIQAVITPEHRGGLGMHYTSVPNIMKVIEPLFLNDLYEEFDASTSSAHSSPAQVIKKLNTLLQRIWKTKLFDPACGSGNFLIIAYKELRRLEMKIFKEIDLANQFHSNQFSGISLGKFYGIELDDFAHEVAVLSLWLAEHQMNQEFFAAFGRTKPALPLTETGKIVHGNACRLDWEQICPKKEGDEIYVLGNPPYLGYSLQSKEQKEDLAEVFSGVSDHKNLDYIACWFLKGAKYIQNQNARFAFVSTNSICQGEQVASLWPHILGSLEIGFAHTSFKWTNNAKANAGVSVVIIGVRDKSSQIKFLFENNRRKATNKISPYLIESDDFVIQKRNNPLSKIQPILRGSGPVDGGYLILSTEEKGKILSKYPTSEKLFKKLIGASELINGDERWCLWIHNDELSFASSILPIEERIKKVREFRLYSSKKGTQLAANFAHRFGEDRHRESDLIIIPSHSSENREYIPIGFLNKGIVITNSAQAIYDASSWNFSILTSRIHMTWIRAVCGSLETRIRYSSQLGYNTFPFPPISVTQKQELEKHVYRILEERETHSEKTLAQLYDPDKMPEGLREAHRQNDLAVERCYRSRPFESNEERLEYLFKLYEQMIEEEKNRGTLFAGETKVKKKRK